MSNANALVWLVTGCSTGFGRYIAEHLLAHGQKVVATARKTERIKDLEARGDALILSLDVENRERCSHVARAAEEHFGRIDVLVNNAGIGYFGAVEETDDATARRLFEVNFFGTANAIHAVLPGMRRRRSGTIVNVTSIGGLSGFPAVGYYCASKFAVEGLSDTLRLELAPLGVRIITVLPSGFRTEWAASAQESALAIPDYDSTAGEARRAYHRSVGRQAGDPARAAAAIMQAVTSAQPPEHLLLGNEAVEVAMAKLNALQANFRAWERLARSADFPTSDATAA